MDLFNRSDVFVHQFFSNVIQNNFMKISLLSFIFWNYIISLYILIFP